jgi:hypothetical protein
MWQQIVIWAVVVVLGCLWWSRRQSNKRARPTRQS